MGQNKPVAIRDPLHVFIKVEPDELAVLDCLALQRLRHIHHLALTSYVYPGATHRRFEHSLGVMDLATRIFDVVTSDDNLAADVKDEILPTNFKREYWRSALRMAALCHDVGHLPFSHAAEKDLLPEGMNHETLTAEIIQSSEMEALWKEMKLDPDDLVAIALEPENVGVLHPWQAILNEMVTGEVFGADRMDYLLRDSLHAGVAYGRFDHFRLIDTLRILRPAPTGEPDASQGRDPQLGVTAGGLQSAEALLLARYFMYSQVYFHKTRRIYDIHLRDFLTDWLPGGRFPLDVNEFLALTDNEVSAALLAASRDDALPGHVHARRIIERYHFRSLFAPNAEDLLYNAAGAKQLYEAAIEEFGAEAVRYDRESKPGALDNPFPVLGSDGRIGSSTSASDVLATIPAASTHHVYVSREKFDEATRWKNENLADLTAPRAETNDEEAVP